MKKTAKKLPGLKKDPKTGRFLKGNNTGNRSGRPPMEHCFSDTARELLRASALDIAYTVGKGKDKKVEKLHLSTTKNFYHGLVAALINEGLQGNVKAIQELINRADGKVADKVITADVPADFVID